VRCVARPLIFRASFFPFVCIAYQRRESAPVKKRDEENIL